MLCDVRRAAPYWQAYSSQKCNYFYSADYAVMNSSTSEGYTIQGRIGFIFREPVVSTVGFYRLYNTALTDHLYTTNETEVDELIKNNGYEHRGYVGFIYKSDVCGAVPLYRLYDAEGYTHYYTTSEASRNYSLEHGYTSQGIAGYVLPNL